MESYPPPQQAAKQISPPSLLGISPPLLTLVSEWHCRARVLDAAEFRSYGHYTWEVNGVATPVPYLCRSAACHGVSIVSSKLFPSMLT
jgi:hypothetical protein